MPDVRDFSKGRAKLADLEIAAQDRLTDSEILLANGRYGSAIALGIYALEIFLKIAICKRLDLDTLPHPFEIHHLDGLLHLTGLKKRMDEPSWAKVKLNWARITKKRTQDLLNELRYEPSDFTLADAAGFIERLRDPTDGVIPWLLTQI